MQQNVKNLIEGCIATNRESIKRSSHKKFQ